MTNEQWEIVNELRMLALGHGGPCCAKAANEIEQLAEAVRFWQEQADKGRRYIEANERGRHQGYELGSPLSRGVDSD